MHVKLQCTTQTEDIINKIEDVVFSDYQVLARLEK